MNPKFQDIVLFIKFTCFTARHSLIRINQCLLRFNFVLIYSIYGQQL